MEYQVCLNDGQKSYLLEYMLVLNYQNVFYSA